MPVCQQILHIFSFFARAACRMSNSLWPQIEALRFAKALASHSPKKRGALREHQHTSRQSRPSCCFQRQRHSSGGQTSSCAVLALSPPSAIISAATPSTFRETLELHDSAVVWLLKLRSWPLLDSLQQHVPGVYKYVYIYITYIIYTYI